ncbi:MAG: preprotein translocase subunit SecE [Bacilli bacterium]|nr:preprotein translocase subunit SecE [Bacilli bacterium]
MKKIMNFFKEVKKEMKKVRWPNKKEMVTYSVATISFVIVFALFFVLTDIVLAMIKTWVA